MDKPKVTPKDFFLWAGAMISLYASAVAFVALFFSYINYAFPDPLHYFPSDPCSSGVSYQMASLLVLFPLFLLLMWVIRRDIAKDSTRQDIWVRRWAIMLTLFVAGAAIAVDLITLIMYFFNGELTLRFLLKVLLVLLVAAAGLMHFLADMWGYWKIYPSRQRSVVYATGALVVTSIVSGFLIIGSPWQARLYRFDEEKIYALPNIQSQVVSYWQAKERLPLSLAELNDPIGGFIVPVDPQTTAPYTYEKIGDLSLKLCATFNAPTQNYGMGGETMARTPTPYGKPDIQNDVWYHAEGEECFERTIDPALYPPYPKTKTPSPV